MLKKKQQTSHSEFERLCNKCYTNLIEVDSTKMCIDCYKVQSVKAEPVEKYELSAYDREFLEMEPVLMTRKILAQVGEMNVKVRMEMKRGRYDWFKPINDSNIEESMMTANRNLQEVVDNGHLIRGHAPKKYTKDGKIFTYQVFIPSFIYS